MFKFRVWDKELKQYACDYGDFVINEDGCLMVLRHRNRIDYYSDADEERYTIEWSTGIQCSETGVDLYVGDLVIFRELKGVIIFDDHFMSFMLEDCEGQYHRICKINQYEKIGNVHDKEYMGVGDEL